jgi:rhomboid protease GluP
MFVIGIESVKQIRLTLSLIVINVLFYFAFNVDINFNFFMLLIQINQNVLLNFEVWRLLTAIFLHADLFHLVSNMFGLLIFGTFLEQYVKKLHYVALYLISGIIGNIFTLMLFPPDTISLGASGAIFGLIGASFYIILNEGEKILIIIGLVYITYFLISSFLPGINVWAHIFGLISGFVYALIAYKQDKFKNFNY